MRITFHTSDKLPDDVAATLVSGDRASSLLLNVGASTEDVAAALTEIATQWADDAWIYVGSVSAEPRLRAL